MRLRIFAATLGLAGMLVLGAWALMESAGSPTAEVVDSVPGGVSVAAKGIILPADAAALDDGRMIADATFVDSSMFDPRPILSASALAWLATLRLPAAMQRFADEPTGSLQAPTIVAVRSTIAVPRLDRAETLTLRHVAQIKESLNLTPDQERHWPALEAELRDLVQRLVAHKAAGTKKAPITAAEAQRLYWAAGPLVLSLRADQKEELRRLARAMGLDQVAALL